MSAVGRAAVAGTNCGRNARKNSDSLGLRILSRQPLTTIRIAAGSARSSVSCRGPDCRNTLHAM